MYDRDVGYYDHFGSNEDRLADNALDEVSDMEWTDVIDELDSYGFDCVHYIEALSGLDAERYNDDAHIMAAEYLKQKDNKLSELKDRLFEHKLDYLQNREPDEDAYYDR